LKKLLYLVLLPLITQVTGCIVFHSVSYEVNVNEDGTGTALLTIEDINTDATTKETIDEDVKSILEHGLKSQQFVDDLKSEGKQIISRKVVVENEKLRDRLRKYEETNYPQRFCSDEEISKVGKIKKSLSLYGWKVTFKKVLKAIKG